MIELLTKLKAKAQSLLQSAKEQMANRYHLSSKQKTDLFRQLAYLIDGGIPTERALARLAGNKKAVTTSQLNWRRAIEKMVEVMQETGSLMKAAESLNIFEMSVIYQIESGEISGDMSPVLLKISKAVDSSGQIRQKLILTMLYPVAMVAVMLGISIYLSNNVLPVFLSVAEELEIEFKDDAKVVMDIMYFVVDYGLYVGVGLAAAIAVAVILVTKTPLKNPWHRFLTVFPGVRRFVIIMDLIRYADVFNSLHQSGVTLDLSLECAARTIHNRYLKGKAFITKALYFDHGLKLTDALDASCLFDSADLLLIEVGIMTDNLDAVFNAIVTRSSDEVDAAVKALSVALTVVLLLIVGLAVGFFAIGFYSAMSSLSMGF